MKASKTFKSLVTGWKNFNFKLPFIPPLDQYPLGIPIELNIPRTGMNEILVLKATWSCSLAKNTLYSFVVFFSLILQDLVD